jgi:hypothetical protein
MKHACDSSMGILDPTIGLIHELAKALVLARADRLLTRVEAEVCSQ